MQIKVSDLRFYIFFIDRSMFSLRICRYSMGKLMIEVLNTFESVKFIKIKEVSRKPPLRFYQIICRGGGEQDLTV